MSPDEFWNNTHVVDNRVNVTQSDLLSYTALQLFTNPRMHYIFNVLDILKNDSYKHLEDYLLEGHPLNAFNLLTALLDEADVQGYVDYFTDYNLNIYANKTTGKFSISYKKYDINN